MKLKNSLKKLSLVKETVAHLSDEHMRNANGGEISIPTLRTRDLNCITETIDLMVADTENC